MRAKLLILVLIALSPLSGHAITTQVVGGQTSVLFGNGALDALGLSIVSVTPNVWGDLGPNSVAFGINPRNAIGGALSTTFDYDSDNFAPFSGAIEHSGRLALDSALGIVEVGDFTIRAAAGRPDGTSGFVVESTFGLAAILFDIANPIIEAFPNSLTIAADILVSPELAGTLGAAELAGADAGMALVVAKSMPIPLPAVGWLFLGGLSVIIPRIRCRTAA